MSQERESRRRSPRRNVTESVLVVDTMTEQAIGRLGNVSESGMLLVAHAPLVEDALYQLRFHLRNEHGREVAIDAGSHLLWYSQANTPGQAFAGLRFLTLDTAAREVLRQWVEAGGEHTH